jgi:hypothetical protein
MNYSVQLNVKMACENLAQAAISIQRAWIANPPSNEYEDSVLNETEIHISNILERLRTIVK